MSYKYYHSASPIGFDSPKGLLINEFQALLDDGFLIASDIFVIQEETSFASGAMKDVTVRINQGTSTVGSQKLGDDFKLVLFQDLDHVVYSGSLFYFDENYWIAYNTNILSNLAKSVLVRRCNNVLRWTDPNGNYHESYCSIDYPIKRPADYVRTVDPVVPGGFINIMAQMNATTRSIKSGQRFLFGNSDNWNCFKVYGSGVRNFLNEKTEDNDSTRLLALVVGTDFVNKDTDNLTLGIADYYDIEYTFSAYPSSFSGDVGDSFLLQPNLKKNGFPSDDNVLFQSSSSAVSVDSTGLVMLVGFGSAEVQMSVEDNTTASAIVDVEVIEGLLPYYEIRIAPSDLFVYEKESQIFEVNSYYRGNMQSDTFAFSVDTSGSVVPSLHYHFTNLGENKFEVENLKKFLEYPLVVSAESGSLIRDFDIELKGSW